MTMANATPRRLVTVSSLRHHSAFERVMRCGMYGFHRARPDRTPGKHRVDLLSFGWVCTGATCVYATHTAHVESINRPSCGQCAWYLNGGHCLLLFVRVIMGKWTDFFPHVCSFRSWSSRAKGTQLGQQDRTGNMDVRTRYIFLVYTLLLRAHTHTHILKHGC